VRRRLAIVGLLLAVLTGCAGGTRSAPAAREVRAAAAADLKFAFDELAAAFQAKHPGITVKSTYGSSGNFFTQISGDAPFDLFLSADVDYPRKLIDKGKAVKDSDFIYAIGHLVVWVPSGSPLDVNQLGLRAVAEPGIRKVAIANPRHAPYGRAAEAALKHAGLYDAVKDRLVLGENVAQAAQFADSGAADIGVFALSLALAPTMRDRGRFVEVPADTYPRLEQGGVILTSAKDPDAVQLLRDFLIGDDGRAILDNYGFRRPEK
jgi:molybdate transport system substrate-binding protein